AGLPRDNHRLHQLPTVAALDADYGARDHFWVLPKNRLDFERVHLVAARVDKNPGPVGDVEVSVTVEMPKVARPVEAVAESLSFIGPLITRGHGRAPNDHLSGPPGADSAPARFGDPHLDIPHRLTDAGPPPSRARPEVDRNGPNFRRSVQLPHFQA